MLCLLVRGGIQIILTVISTREKLPSKVKLLFLLKIYDLFFYWHFYLTFSSDVCVNGNRKTIFFELRT